MAEAAALTPALDVDWVRRQFEGLGDESVLFDNSGGSQILSAVVERIADWYRSSNVQLGASYGRSQLASVRLAQAQATLARMIGAADAAEVVIGPSSTQLVFNLSQALAQGFVAGDEIIVSAADHAANVGPWQRLAARGMVIRFWPVDPDSGRLDTAALEPLLNPRTRLVCFTHCSNVIGAIEPAAALVKRIHAAGALALVDGVAFAPHRQVDVQAIGADFYVLSLYKVFGPHLSLLHIKQALFRKLPGINHPFISEDDLPYKLQPGNANYELTWGAAGIPDHLQALGQGDPAAGWNAIAAHESLLVAHLLDWLSSKSGVRVIGPATSDASERVAIVSFTARGHRPADLVAATDAQGVGIRHGHFYSPWLIDALGLADNGGVVRVSMAHYNSMAEVERLIHALDPVLD